MASFVRSFCAVSAAQPSAHFLVAHPAHFVALGFGAGLSPVAPGTVGTLLALPIAALLRNVGGDATFAIAIVAFLVVGAWAAHVTGRDLGVADHGSIVVDEIAAFLLMLFFVGADPWRQAIAFVLFRAFDILKPPPIRQLDAAWKNGLGVMADDLLAAAYALVVFAIGQLMLGG
jgi:phosphatidylglycerophosphatase A